MAATIDYCSGVAAGYEATIHNYDIPLGDIAYGNDGKIIGIAPWKMINDEVLFDLPEGNWIKVYRGSDRTLLLSQNGRTVACLVDGTTEWQTATLPSNFKWTDICYGGGVFVLIGDMYGYACWSDDGLAWNFKILPNNINAVGVCYGDGIFLIYGRTSYSAFSTDGKNWTSIGTRGVYSACYGNGKFLLTHGSFYISTSANAQIWSEKRLKNSSSNLTMSCAGGGKYIAGGYKGDIFRSDDAETWVDIKNKFAALYSWKFSAYGNGKFVIIHGQPTKMVFVSEDTENWQFVWLPSVVSISSLSFIDGNFVITGTESDTGRLCIMYSDDAINWVSKRQERSYILPISKVHVALPGGGSQVLKYEFDSSISELWETSEPYSGTIPISVAYGNGILVSIGTGDTVMRSVDGGKTWTGQTLPANRYWRAVCFGNDKFVAVCSSGAGYFAAYSYDGIVWFESNLPASGWDVCYDNGLFVAATDRTIYYSADGIEWELGFAPSGSVRYFRGIAGGNGNFVALNEDSDATAVIRSSDGKNWEFRSTSNFYGVSICYGRGLFVAISTGRDVIVSRDDGRTWIHSRMPGNETKSSNIYRCVCYGDGVFVAVGENIVAYSVDGLDWYAEPISEINGLYYCCCTTEDGFVAISTSGRASRSKKIGYKLSLINE